MKVLYMSNICDLTSDISKLLALVFQASILVNIYTEIFDICFISIKQMQISPRKAFSFIPKS